jgi:pimeloyl-ACP methyl ester carboxylesterase
MLACERHGSGEPLVLVHGVTHRRQAWYPVLDLLAAEREIILVDLPGHGQSPDFVLGGRSVEDALREEFRTFLADQGLVRPHVAGNSLGGLVALEAGATGDARSVTALSPAGFWRDNNSFAYTRRLFTTATTIVESLGSRSDLLARTRAGRRIMYSTLLAHPMRVPADYALGDVRAFQRAIPTLRILLAAARTFDAEIPNDVPVTIAWGARDLILPPWQAEVAKERLPQAEHVMMRGVGHVPMWDDPRHIARVLLRGSAAVAAVAPLTAVGGTATRTPRRRVAAGATA